MDMSARNAERYLLSRSIWSGRNSPTTNKNQTIPAEYNPTNYTTRLKCAGATRKERTLPHLDNLELSENSLLPLPAGLRGRVIFWRKDEDAETKV